MGDPRGVPGPDPASAARPEPSSRRSKAGAGWVCGTPGEFRALRPTKAKFSWLRPSVLWRSRNDVLAHRFGDPSGRVRRRWVAAQRARGADPDFRIGAHEDASSYSFLVLGDPGEGDASQYAVVPGMLKIGEGTAFAVIASDVVYPTGEGDDYCDKFFRPFSGYRAPIYAVPGNHDWYDGLGGFMRVFCDAPGLPPAKGDGLPPLWRHPAKIDEAKLATARAMRGDPSQRAEQPGPYWVLDTGPLRVVGIDTGITGTLDAEQGDWLRRVSRVAGPKLLITGKPIYDRNAYKPCPIEGGGTVDEIVRDPANGYVAVIGGDIHNYQHYPVNVDGRTIHYVVAGGGGAFMHATHTIRRVDVGGVAEDSFRCYPLRGDSLSFYSQLYARRLRMGWLYIPPDQAALITARQIGNKPVRPIPPGVTITRKARWAARLLGAWPWPFRLPVGTVFQRYVSELSDWDEPPFFKSFLRVSVTPEKVVVSCYAATGCREHELDPPLEDEFEIEL
ncbi:metallophosphoesterase family protein [Bailinhaonella thermotolerans]|uniref:Metallophosphoesterase n=1 Tax=Bailinhaonella thermotolerans TaxID=1070861 RepID=A0A3A4B7T9_9ACTN|nr:metallophosphoesterase [Bailinhaonella thermotolerans]RJL34627.1 metallophosphoesterase [Bailinhaonella thermotolerans]